MHDILPHFMGSATGKSWGGQRKLDWASDWNVTKLHCINKVKCHKMLI